MLTLVTAQAYISISTPVGALDAEDEESDDQEDADVDEPAVDESSDPISDDDSSDTDDAESVFSDDESSSSLSDGQGTTDDDTSIPFDLENDDFDDSVDEALVATDEDLSSLRSAFEGGSLSAREIISLYALSRVLRSTKGQSAKRSAVQLVNLVTLRHCKLAQRSFTDAANTLGRPHDSFMHRFSSWASKALSGWFAGDFASAAWDAYDLFDGRLYLQISLGYANLQLPEHMQKEVEHLADILKTLSEVDVSEHLPKPHAGTVTSSGDGKRGTGHAQNTRQKRQLSLVLPFSHPIMDPYLEPIQVKTAALSDLPKAPKIFQELTHWHNAKKPLDPKYIPKPPGFFMRKRNQKFMADTIAYSASLSGSSGKIIDPEIIVVQTQAPEKKAKPQAQANAGQDWKAALKEKAAASKTKKPAAAAKKQPAKSGKQKALEAAEALRAAKTEDKSAAVVAFWAKRCIEFEKEPSLTKRYTKAQRYFLEVSSTYPDAVGAEVSLYLCHVLALVRNSKNEANKSGKCLIQRRLRFSVFNPVLTTQLLSQCPTSLLCSGRKPSTRRSFP
jgi:hypothetical protein